MSRIFISYRRAESEGYVGRLYDNLLQHFDKKEIFLDVGTIKPGEDFVSIIANVVGSCDVLIAVIGPRWLEIRDKNGKRRLESANDYVRLEIATALARNILVVPALIEGASMPDAKELPKDLAALCRRNAIELSHDRFAYDVDLLVHAIGGSYGKMVVSLGKTYLSMIAARVMSSMEVFEIIVDRQLVGKIEGPGFSFKRENQKKTSWWPVAGKVREGVHKVFIVNRKYANDPLPKRSNELSFKIRGGQSIAFTIDFETSSIGVSQLVLKSYKPIIEP
jgi:hypothetical protein